MVRLKMQLNEIELENRIKVEKDNFLELYDQKNKIFETLIDNLSKAKHEFMEKQLENNQISPYLFCPSCLKNQFYLYSITDEHDTYTGFKCQNCKFDHSTSH